MRYVVYGAGAVGGVIGGHLHLAGLPTTLVARGDHLDAIRARGLQLDTADGVRTVDAPVTSAVSDIDWSDDTVVLLTVKSHQTAVALDDLLASAPAATPVVCAQNGVANESATLRAFPHTYAMCVMLPALHLEAGTVVQKCWPTAGILDVGRFPADVGEVAEAIAADLRTAGFASQARADIMAWKYRKLLSNAAGDVAAVLPPGREVEKLADRVVAEGEAVLAAAGIRAVTAEADAERRGDLLLPRPDIASYRGNSLTQSIVRGLPTEVQFRVGELVLLGRLHGVSTPACELVLRAALDR